MKKLKSSKLNKKSAKSTSKTVVKVQANARLVAALKKQRTAMEESKSYLVEAAEIAQNEDLTRQEVVASIMAARGIEKSSAESQYTRLKKIFTDPDALEALKNGEVDLKTAVQKTSEKREPSAKTKEKNAEKAAQTALGTLFKKAKEVGWTKRHLIRMIETGCKANGIK
jgi:hypothetical protein